MPPRIDAEEAEANRPPRIILDLVRPDIETSVELGCGERQHFDASVEDPDTGDQLYFRVFLDYAAASDAFRQSFAPRQAKASSVSGTRLFSLDFFVEANEAAFRNPLLGAHTVELMVADRPFASEQDPQLGLVGRQLADDEGRTDTYAWLVAVTETCP